MKKAIIDRLGQFKCEGDGEIHEMTKNMSYITLERNPICLETMLKLARRAMARHDSYCIQ